jgi:hypothetical protein
MMNVTVELMMVSEVRRKSTQHEAIGLYIEKEAAGRSRFRLPPQAPGRIIHRWPPMRWCVGFLLGSRCF